MLLLWTLTSTNWDRISNICILFFRLEILKYIQGVSIIHICILLKEKQSFEKGFDKKMLLVNHYQTDLCSKFWGESQFLPYFLLPCASQPILKRRTRARILKWQIEFRLDVISNPRLTATFLLTLKYHNWLVDSTEKRQMLVLRHF